MRSIFTLSVAVLLTACATTGGANMLARTNLLSVGMDKAEIISIMGQPTGTRAIGNVEYLTYLWKPVSCGTILGFTSPECANASYAAPINQFVVRLIDGRADAYGDIGDFDLGKEDNLNIDLDVENK